MNQTISVPAPQSDRAAPNSTHSTHWTEKLELALLILTLLYFTELNIEPRLISLANVASYGVVGVLVCLNLKHWKRLLYVSICDLPLLLLLGVATLSVFWSSAPDFTSDETKALLRASALGFYMAFRYSPREQMRILVWTVGIAAVLSSFYAVTMPSYGTHIGGEHAGLWKGIYAHKQYLGRLMTVGLVPFVLCGFDSPRHRHLYFAGAGLVLMLILLSGSKTSLTLLILSLTLLPFYQMVRQSFKTRVVLLSLAVVVTGLAVILLVTNIETVIVNGLGKSLDLNSRGPVWAFAIEKGLQQPWLGYGYSGFWTSSEAQTIYNGTWAGAIARSGVRFHAHNGFIDTFLQVGLVGLGLCILMFLRSIRDAVTLMTSREYGVETFWMLQFLIITLLFNVTETRTFLASNTFWTITISIALMTKLQCRRRWRHPAQMIENPIP